MFGKRILVLIAHPDDEVVACAASIAQAKAGGAEVFGLYLTHGCLAQDVMWRWKRKNYDQTVAIRQQEAESAARLLGLSRAGWSPRPARYLWREMTQVRAEVETAIAHCRPDQLWAPAYEGGNPDHDALNAIAAGFRKRVSVLEFAEYNFFGGRARSNIFIAPDETVRILALTEDEAAAKRAALEIYASERSNLSAIACEQESYRPLGIYDYRQPPHQGKLWYTRFQWVPFKHPRVDATGPAEVSEAITAFQLREPRLEPRDQMQIVGRR